MKHNKNTYLSDSKYVMIFLLRFNQKFMKGVNYYRTGFYLSLS